MATSSIVQEAWALAAEDRAKLAEIETVWTQEIEKRIAAFDRSETPAYTTEDVSAAAVKDATTRALAFPLAGPPATKNARRAFLKNFPFAVVYRPDADGIAIFTLAHRSHRPRCRQLRTQVR